MTTTSPTVTAPRGRHAAPARPVRAIGSRWWWIGGAAASWPVLAYVPLLAVRPGRGHPRHQDVLYLDPVRFLSQVAFMWNPTVGLGTVTHEYIGYLLPMGPFFAIFHLLGVPVWVAQRLWLGSILMAAGLGILYLSRILGLRGPGPDGGRAGLHAVAVLPAVRRPYLGDPAAVGRACPSCWPSPSWPLRRGGWRKPALFALVVALVSGINASSIIYVGVAPILWIVYAVVVLREATWRQALGTALRIGVLTLGACLWWIAGLAVEAGLRRQRPEVHRDRPLDVGHLQRVGRHPGPRLLVLLRLRPPRARGRTPPSASPRTSGCWSPRTPCRSSPGGRRVRALARAGLLHPAGGRRA